MSNEDPFQKALREQLARDNLRRQAQGERTGLTDRRHRSDPTASSRVATPNVSGTSQNPEPTPDWLSGLNLSEAPVNLNPESDPIRRNVQAGGVSSQRLPASAESELDRIRRQLRKAYGRDES